MKINTAKDTAQDVYILSVCCLKDDCLFVFLQLVSDPLSDGQTCP